MTACVVGRVAGLWRYPVKSMAAQQLDEVEVSWHGLSGDRRWAFVRDGLERSDFPWLTIRERPSLGRYHASFVDPARPDDSVTMVRTPGGEDFDVVDPLLAVELGDDVRVIKQRRGVFDTMPLALITSQSIAGLVSLAGTALGVERFRPNLLVEATGDAEFPEDSWVGGVLQIGGARMRVDKRDQRCVVVNVDPVTSERDSTILRMIARERQTCLGVYGSTVLPGRIAVGDEVVLEPSRPLRGP